MDTLNDSMFEVKTDIQEIKSTTQMALAQILSQLSSMKVASNLPDLNPTAFQKSYHSSFLPNEPVSKPKGEMISRAYVSKEEDVVAAREMTLLTRLRQVAAGPF